jgi:plastocyanin
MTKTRMILAGVFILLAGFTMTPQTVFPLDRTMGLEYRGATETPDKEVEIEDFEFRPGTIVIPAGTAVRWTNKDSVPHTVTSDTAGVFDSGVLQPGESYEFLFDIPGTYTYHCAIHPSMTGTVVVSGQLQRAFLPLVAR